SERHPFAGRRNATEFAQMRAAPDHVDRDDVALGDHVLDRDVKIRKRRAPLAVTLAISLRPPRAGGAIDVLWRDELLQPVVGTGVERFLYVTAHERLVRL